MSKFEKLIMFGAALIVIGVPAYAAVAVSPWALIPVGLFALTFFNVGRLFFIEPHVEGKDMLEMKIQSLEMQLADERAMVSAMTEELDPSDF